MTGRLSLLIGSVAAALLVIGLSAALLIQTLLVPPGTETLMIRETATTRELVAGPTVTLPGRFVRVPETEPSATSLKPTKKPNSPPGRPTRFETCNAGTLGCLVGTIASNAQERCRDLNICRRGQNPLGPAAVILGIVGSLIAFVRATYGAG